MSFELADFVSASRHIGKRHRCPLEPILNALNANDRRVLEGALDADQRDISAGAVVNVLKRHGHDINPQIVASHRRRTCTCFKA